MTSRPSAGTRIPVTPEDVAVLDRVELDAGQRHLYEEIKDRVANRIRSAISEPGFERSRMDVLEALLRLQKLQITVW